MTIREGNNRYEVTGESTGESGTTNKGAQHTCPEQGQVNDSQAPHDDTLTTLLDTGTHSRRSRE